MVRDVEGNTQKLPSIADCWKWQKGLLHDFMLAKKQVERSPSNMAESRVGFKERPRSIQPFMLDQSSFVTQSH